jgi:tRNA(Arg) A34 adenosine deaminase TadA
MPSPELVARLLDVIEHEVVPLTRRGVARGNKIFGAAILRKADLSEVVVETNNEVENPLWHGEMHAIKRFHELPRPLPAPEKLLFLATHEPCSLCLSGITWAGFDNFSYLFSHQDSADRFEIPHDISILRAVYAVPDPDRDAPAEGRDLYNRTNSYFESTDLAAAVRELADEALLEQVERITHIYEELSAAYLAGKAGRGIPLA